MHGSCSHVWKTYGEWLLSSHISSWKSILLLSMILPIALFTGLKVTGITPTPEPETITLAPRVWQFNRTPDFTIINQSLTATYGDNSSQMSFLVLADGLFPATPVMSTYIDLGLEFTATPLTSGFSVASVLVYFGSDIQPSATELDLLSMSIENLTVRSMVVSGEQAGVLLLGNVSQGSGCHFFVVAFWWLFAPDNVTCQRQVNFEVTYFNGTAYERIVQSFDLTLFGS